ncbi:hypothetical protein B9Q11_02590 [Candidatus Marsarchaeota G2 archaeon ECH_B_SAG-F08]|jgi:Lrp/AsnC family transcriptional regulator for asnA, asnC and gidA|uniref:HTH asnC-type domain-containing protein n=5 Tax=Candidatus Marsarchaeota TaxID=1978152 RepID=A0A2R6AEG0_9ARCH|nr:MAG: hypothetical protein B9Q01_03480 [Candidatus Marsarchaeota G1 archaeon OSP_D]PSN84729.1 MAG: hypothetical protein B9Q02_09060 [Candidatus Marsarchaeota G1 archaeon BE_D]PSN87953.1 MAG: hypothetical protein B9Q00_07290 [Candidatus Marsarchaeota G1 archaeon OSP_C]PSN98227.1 MAG: hypothetical protein B9Q11_02590 [Candidatus Marsarchaeota G2 archaeon ECH_B_SAG-F08]PSO04316.1 MAG: hypothetical protein B9Q13_04975 [Candidatus Marsarchaeota G2 archaeon ECH_B_SAG-G16]
MPKFSKSVSEEIDKRIIEELKLNSRVTFENLAKKIGVSTSTVYNRIRALRKKGVIRGYTIVLDRAKSGSGTGALLLITIDGQANVETVSSELCKLNEVESVYEIGGEADIVVLVFAQSIEKLRELVNDKINSIKGVSNVTPLVILKTYKEYGMTF